MKSREVVEWAPFRVTSGVTEAQLLDASRALQEGFLAKRQGFLRRELLRGMDGQWVDVVHWADPASAREAMAAAAESETCHAYFRLMAEVDHGAPEAGVLLFDRVATYG